jgi:8-oxo-dGTP diphosphatase
MRHSNQRQEHDMGAGIMLTCKKKVLILKRANYKKDPFGGYWNFPGGKTDNTESAYETALRETFEETGFEERDIKIYKHVESRGYTMFIGVLDEEYMPVLDEEHTEYKWVDIEEVRNYILHPKDERCFKKYLASKKK